MSRREWEVQAILDHKLSDTGQVVYRVRWNDYSEAHDTWEPPSNLSGCIHLFRDYVESSLSAAAKSLPGGITRTKEPKKLLPKKQPKKLPPKKQLKKLSRKKVPQKQPAPSKALKAATVRQKKDTQKRNEDDEKEADDTESDEEEWVVDAVTEHRITNGQVSYRVHWHGFTKHEDTWEPREYVDHTTAFQMYLEHKIFIVGEIVWCKVSNYPPWPCMVWDPSLGPESVKVKKPSPSSKKDTFHLIKFFGENSWLWARPNQLTVFRGDHFEGYSRPKRLRASMREALSYEKGEFHYVELNQTARTKKRKAATAAKLSTKPAKARASKRATKL